MRLFPLLFLAIPLATGCVDSSKVGQNARFQSLVGGSEADLVRRLGAAPTTVAERNGVRYLTWMYYWPEQDYGAVATQPVSMPGDADRATRFCEASFAVEQGRVAGYSMRGEWCGFGGYPRVAPT